MQKKKTLKYDFLKEAGKSLVHEFTIWCPDAAPSHAVTGESLGNPHITQAVSVCIFTRTVNTVE